MPMTDADHFRHYKPFLNPSLDDRFDYDPLETFDPELSIQENCWHSEGNGQADFGFWMDGHYHSLLVLHRWPKMTYPGIIQRLTNLPLLDYTITVNVDPLSATHEISKEEKEHDRLAGDYASEKRISLLTVMEKKQKKIAALMQGHTLPFHAIYSSAPGTRRATDSRRRRPRSRTRSTRMNGAQYLRDALCPATSKKLFFQTWPGWPWGRYPHRKLYAETRYLADMLPVSATFTGHLEDAEAIYDGPRNLVGVKTFSGTAGNKTPQHAVLLGMSGAGKTVTVCDLLSQTEALLRLHRHHRGRTLLRNLHATVEPNARPIIIQPDGDLTINYLDTHGLPLTADHLSAATALVARMIGVSADEDKQMLRAGADREIPQSALRGCLSGLEQAQRRASRSTSPATLARSQHFARQMPPGATTLDAFADFRDWQRDRPRRSR